MFRFKSALPILALASYTFAAYAGEFIPRSFYLIDEDGQKSDIVYFRSKRDVELFPLLRLRRGGGSSASSQSSASASSSSSSGGGGGGGDDYNGGNGYNPSFVDPGYNPGYFGNGGGGAGAQSSSFASASSSSNSGTPSGAGYGGPGGVGNTGYNGPILFSRFGEDTGTGVKVSGSAAGQKGAFSSSSSSIDGDGKIKYSVQSGKY